MPTEPKPMSAAEIANEMANGIEQAGLHPAYAFARFVTAGSWSPR